MLISISRSLGRKLVATAAVAAGFVLTYEATVMDFRYIARPAQAPDEEAPLPAGGVHLKFTATAYLLPV